MPKLSTIPSLSHIGHGVASNQRGHGSSGGPHAGEHIVRSKRSPERVSVRGISAIYLIFVCVLVVSELFAPPVAFLLFLCTCALVCSSS